MSDETATEMVERTRLEASTKAMDKKIPLVELFGPTIQGEGLVAGQRTFFLRFGLCDYKCTMCDSMHAVDPLQVKANATWMTQEEIFQALLQKAKDNNCNHVTLSGGNPCIHDLTHLVRLCREHGIKTALETQGTFKPDWVRMVDWITVSPKGPGMGEKFEARKFKDYVDEFYLDGRFCVKIPVFSAADLEFASDVASLIPTNMMSDERFYLSVGNSLPPGKQPKDLHPWTFHDHYVQNIEIILEELRDYPVLRYARLLPQTHVLIWGNKQGV
jgi:7-carboxy-7-deazaguanine synthase